MNFVKEEREGRDLWLNFGQSVWLRLVYTFFEFLRISKLYSIKFKNNNYYD